MCFVVALSPTCTGSRRPASLERSVVFGAPVRRRAPPTRTSTTPTPKSFRCEAPDAGNAISRRRAGLAVGALGALALASGKDQAVRAARIADTFGMIYDTSISSYLPPRPRHLRAFRKRVSSGGVFAIGEIHTQPLHHRLQLEMLKAAHELSPRCTVGCEMVLAEHQPFLDAFVSGDLSMRTLLRKLKWDSTWGYDIKLYAPIFRFCRLHQIPIAGLNISPSIVSKIGQRGLASLSPQERAALPELVLDDERHLAHFMQLMATSGVAAGGSLSLPQLRNYYHAKVLWDEQMAESAARFAVQRGVVEPDGAGGYRPAGVMLLFAGSAHVEGRSGVPDRLERRLGVAPFVVVPREVAFDRDAQPLVGPELPDEAEADWVWYTRRELDLL